MKGTLQLLMFFTVKIFSHNQVNNFCQNIYPDNFSRQGTAIFRVALHFRGR